MRKKFLVLAMGFVFSGSSGILHAEGNFSAGKEKSASCDGCHGLTGNSVTPTFPKLAQQHASYLVKELQAFKDGTRQDPIMGPMAMALSEEDMMDIAAYYAAQKISQNAMPEPPEDDEGETVAAGGGKKPTIPELIAQGSDLYRNGDLAREVSACIACHGPFGEGNKPAAFPMLKSQHADYLIKSLNDFKSGARSDNPEHMMHMIAKKMTEEEIRAVSYHISMMK